MTNKNHFHINDFALSLVLMNRLEATRAWPITLDNSIENCSMGSKASAKRTGISLGLFELNNSNGPGGKNSTRRRNQ